MNNKDQKQALFILLVSAIVLFILILVIISTAIFKTVKGKQSVKPGTITEHETSETYIPPDDENWQEADNHYEKVHGNSVAIVDDNSLLSREDYLSTQAHFIICDEITAYLNDNGYPECEIVSVIPESVTSNNKNAIFSVSLDKYPDVILNIESYYETGTFKFSIQTLEN